LKSQWLLLSALILYASIMYSPGKKGKRKEVSQGDDHDPVGGDGKK
jgi:hypothetical protein